MDICFHHPYSTSPTLPTIGPEGVSLLPGDFFGTSNPSAVLGKMIEVSEKYNSRDNEAVYTHSGVIINSLGDTVESLWTVSGQNIWKAYAGQQVIIARWNHLNPNVWENVYLETILPRMGQSYPWWRLPLHLVPPLAKYIAFKSSKLVCSEFVALIEYKMMARHRWYTGTNPDTLADEWKRWKGFSVVAEGLLK